MAIDGAAGKTAVKDVTTASFKADVLTASIKQPVLVDFWAPWCGPCKQLAPVLEKAVAEAKGKVTLVKMNIDDHPQIAGQLGIQSIPAVIAFERGQPVDGFMGALPESQVRGFIERLVGPLTGGSDALIAEAEAAAESGDADHAAELYARVLTEDETNPKAIGGLARLHVAAGDLEAARGVLALAAPPAPGKEPDPAIAAAIAALQPCRTGRERRRSRAVAEGAGRQPRRSSGALRPRRGAQRARRARSGGRGAADHHQARPRLERGRRAQAIAAILRGLGADGQDDGRGAAQAVGDLVLERISQRGRRVSHKSRV